MEIWFSDVRAGEQRSLLYSLAGCLHIFYHSSRRRITLWLTVASTVSSYYMHCIQSLLRLHPTSFLYAVHFAHAKKRCCVFGLVFENCVLLSIWKSTYHHVIPKGWALSKESRVTYHKWTREFGGGGVGVGLSTGGWHADSIIVDPLWYPSWKSRLSYFYATVASHSAVHQLISAVIILKHCMAQAECRCLTEQKGSTVWWGKPSQLTYFNPCDAIARSSLFPLVFSHLLQSTAS